MLTINDPQSTGQANVQQKIWQKPVFDLLFRSHFLLASLASIISLTMWLSFMTHGFAISNEGLTPLVWHIHEMIFTFASTVAVGFIMTAVQTWTGKASIKGGNALVLCTIWLCSHLLFWINTHLSVCIAITLKMLWWLFIISFYTKLVLSANNNRNFVFIPILAVMAIFNVSIVLLDLFDHTVIALYLAKAMVLVFIVLITVLAGRVIPFFTANATKTTPASPINWLEKTVLWSSISAVVLYLISIFFTHVDQLLAVVLIFSGIMHLVRMTRWRTTKTLNVPLLWSLHLAYIFMAIGLIFMGLSTSIWSEQLPSTYGVHLITIGSIGLMILAMMSRVSLGHTGRMLTIPRIIVLSFYLLVLATVTRVLLPLFGLVAWGWTISALCWIIAFVSFLAYYTPILVKPRI